MLEQFTDSGLTDSDIALLLEVTQPTIHYARKRLNIKTQNNPHFSYNIDEIKQLALKDKTTHEISEDLSIAYSTLCWIMRKHDIKTKKTRRNNKT